MTSIVSAIYREGKLELLEVPVGIHDGKVRLIVIEDNETPKGSTPLQFGKYRTGTMSTEDDFVVAEWRDDKIWNHADGK